MYIHMFVCIFVLSYMYIHIIVLYVYYTVVIIVGCEVSGFIEVWFMADCFMDATKPTPVWASSEAIRQIMLLGAASRMDTVCTERSTRNAFREWKIVIGLNIYIYICNIGLIGLLGFI